MSTENIGEKLRQLRQEHGLPLRKVAALLDMDVAILSKMERGERRLTREVVQKLAKIYQYDEEKLLVLYLSDKVLYEIGDEEFGIRALQVAEQKATYSKIPKFNKNSIISAMKTFFQKDQRIIEAWIFGSFARGDENFKSDIDLLVDFDKNKKISLFDMADIAFQLEKLTNRKIDLVEKGTLRPFALETAQKDFIKIYG